MKRRTTAVVIVITITACSLMIGCGSGVISEQRERPASPAAQIDPFEFGDEFSTQTETPSSGTIPVDTGYTAPETYSPSPAESMSAPGSGSLLDPGERTIYRIQLSGAFDNRAEADRYAERARRRLDTRITVEYRAPFYRVFAGSFGSQEDAETYVRFLRQEGFNDSRWVPVIGATP